MIQFDEVNCEETKTSDLLTYSNQCNTLIINILIEGVLNIYFLTDYMLLMSCAHDSNIMQANIRNLLIVLLEVEKSDFFFLVNEKFILKKKLKTYILN